MYEIEIVVFIICAVFSFLFLRKWYRLSLNAWPPDRSKSARLILTSLPAVSIVIIYYALRVLASFDVVDSFIYIVFYVVMGFAWLYLGVTLMFAVFDLSWADDALYLNNKAALFAVTGGFIGLTAIYSGANVGDGPGWWCVVFAGGLGLAAWIVLGLVINFFTNIFERITIERDIACGIRFGFYLLAAGIILGRASAGDWTSFYMTIVEFIAGWPILPLTALMLLIEVYYIQKSKSDYHESDNYFSGSIFWGIVYVMIAAGSVILFLPPLV